MTNNSFDRARFRAEIVSRCYRRHDVSEREREAVVKRSDMIDPRLEPNFGFDFLD